MFRQVQVDTLGNLRDYSIFDGGIFGTPSLSSKSGNININLTNILEAKVFQRNDTTGKAKNVKLIDNFNVSTAYNVFADSLNWAPLSMVMRTSLFEKINISSNAGFSLYGYDSRGRIIGKFYKDQAGKLARLTTFSVSLDMSLNELINTLSGNEKTPASSPQGPQPSAGTGTPAMPAFDRYGYAVFNVPWTMNVSYSINYSKPAMVAQVIQSLSVNGSVTLTRNMSLTYNSGYDFTRKEITMTQIHVNRDLHCWQMSFDWVPNGYMKMWTFSIRVKASVLADLKYERRKDYHDNY
jgi:hypothetical protein